AGGSVPRPLRKCTPNGTVYTRPTAVETAIDAALALDHETLFARAEILDRRAPEFLCKEVLVHLIRDARRQGDEGQITRLFGFLRNRCEAMLERDVPVGFPHAYDIRNETLSELGERFATDEPKRLDFFEVKFELAFERLRKTIARGFLRLSKREATLEDLDD